MSVIQDDYVKQAEVIRGLPKKKNGFELTTTQLRVLLSRPHSSSTRRSRAPTPRSRVS